MNKTVKSEPKSTTRTDKKARGVDASKTRAKIIKAAQKCFVAKGFNGTSMRDIAQKAKVTQSLLHHHFGNKETLWQLVKFELMNRYFEGIEKRIETEKCNKDQQRRLEDGLENRFRFMQKNPDVVRMSLWQRLDNFKGHSTEKGRNLLRILIKKVRLQQKSGEIRSDIEPEMLVIIMFILSSGWFQQEYGWVFDYSEKPHDKKQDAESYLLAIKKILARGIAQLSD